MIKPKAPTRTVPPNERALTFKELKDYGVDYTRSWVDKLEKAGKFPRRFAQGGHVFWLEREIVSWRRTAIAQRSHKLGVLGSHGKIKGHGKYRAPETDPEPDPLSSDKA